jgi:hypothetical protein
MTCAKSLLSACPQDRAKFNKSSSDTTISINSYPFSVAEASAEKSAEHGAGGTAAGAGEASPAATDFAALPKTIARLPDQAQIASTAART